MMVSIAQNDTYTVSSIPENLLPNANAVIRNSEFIIDLKDFDNMYITVKRVVTVLNKKGLKHVDAYVPYDKDRTVKNIEAKIYDASGEILKKIKRKDFKDYSNNGSNLFSDNRVISLDYTPTQYPFTIMFNYEVQTNSTAFLPRWYPVENYLLSVENSSFTINNPNEIELNIKEFNLDNSNIEAINTVHKVHYKAENLRAYKREVMSPSFNEIMPRLMVAAKKFKLINIEGNSNSWNDFGKWNYENLIKNRDDISDETKQEVTTLVAGISDPMEKAKLIYQYVQDKTRYISVQLGIGGWQPILASKVDEVSYGDCKALTNYTKALMESQGIEAYYTIVYGDSNKRDIEEDFIAMQGNHVILNLPNDGDPIWLECTSQKVPFGFIANFTDDRDVFVITPDGGKIEHTKIYSSKENYLHTEAFVNIDSQGNINAELESKSSGTQYNQRLHLKDLDSKKRDIHYKDYWSYVNNISIKKISINNDRNAIQINEKLHLSASKYAVKTGDKMLIKPNVFNRYSDIPPRYVNRKFPFEIQRGFLDTDTYTIALPEGYRSDVLPEAIEIKTKFGIYTCTYQINQDSNIVYQRTFEIFKGQFPKEEYKDFRAFVRSVAKSDRTSLVVIKNQ